MTTRLLDIEHLALLEKLLEVLDENERDPVKQQIAIELLTLNHAARMGSRGCAVLVAHGIHKHVLQLIDQWAEAAKE